MRYTCTAREAGKHSKMKFIENSTLIVGSAPDASVITDAHVPKSIALIAVNNAWRLRSDFLIHISPNDFPDANKPPPDYKLHRVQNGGYIAGLRRAGGVLFCGATMSFCSGYYALSARPERIIGFLGCNMVYEGTNTHFYGKGEPDPIKVQAATYASIKDLKAKAARLFLYGLLQDTLILNLLPHPNGQMSIPTTRFEGDIIKQYQSLMNDKSLHKILIKAAGVLMKEREFPANRHSMNLIPISRDPTLMAFIDSINADWKSLGAEALLITDRHLN